MRRNLPKEAFARFHNYRNRVYEDPETDGVKSPAYDSIELVLGALREKHQYIRDNKNLGKRIKCFESFLGQVSGVDSWVSAENKKKARVSASLADLIGPEAEGFQLEFIEEGPNCLESSRALLPYFFLTLTEGVASPYLERDKVSFWHLENAVKLLGWEDNWPSLSNLSGDPEEDHESLLILYNQFFPDQYPLEHGNAPDQGGGPP